MRPTEKLVKLLVIEDDPILGNSITRGLVEQGYHCRLASNGEEAMKLAGNEPFHVVILDLALQDKSGLGVLRSLRGANEHASVIILTSMDSHQERMAGLEAGAEDFLIKPFALTEMSARVEATLVRSRIRPISVLSVGPISMDLTLRKVTRSGRQLNLTPTEFRLLEILMRNQGEVVTRRMLCESLWSSEWEGVTNVIEVHINRLRRKMSSGAEPRMIFTIRGRGYSLRWEPAGGNNAPTTDSSDPNRSKMKRVAF